MSESLTGDRYEDDQMGYLQSSENLNKLQSVFRKEEIPGITKE